MLPAPWLLALALVVGLLVLIPARRLQLGGVSARAAGAYVPRDPTSDAVPSPAGMSWPA